MEIRDNGGAEDVQDELALWGHKCQAIRFGRHDRYLCLPAEHVFPPGSFHYMFSNDDHQDHEGCFLHTQATSLTNIGMLKILERLGYPRAVITSRQQHSCGMHIVQFVNSQPIAPPHQQPHRERTAWPDFHVPEWSDCPLYTLDSQKISAASTQVSTNFNSQDLQDLIAASSTFLSTNFDDLDLPDYVKEAVSVPRRHRQYHRWLIYTDGSSQASMRRVIPEQADELGMPDTWAMIVLGEHRNADGTSDVDPIGWCAHPVRYDVNGQSYTHATRIGAEVAERDALIWAGIWRLTQDTVTPTVICCDSLTCGRQAFGQMGTGNPDPSYRILRGIYQALSHGLGSHFQLHHVKAHAGDPYNEFVDLMAKAEMLKSFNHPRPALDLRRWNQVWPHFWLIFASSCGLPPWQDGVMQTPKPSLPPKSSEQSATKPRATREQVNMTLSLVTANVLSLSRAPDGHAGKLRFLYEQMLSFHINIMGIQESRADAGTTTSHQVLRLSGGHDQHRCGVELWVNLAQPIGYTKDGNALFFTPNNFQPVHCDPRRLLVRVVHDALDCWFFVGHAPHSGRPMTERQQWWSQTHDILARYLDQNPSFWMFDANAAPGGADNVAVFQKGLPSSGNTSLWRDCLDHHAMCLPSTTCIHQGERSTWTSPDGVHEHCIDYVAIPTTWLSSCTWSQVLDTFDLATVPDDHKAVGLQLQWTSSWTQPARHERPVNVDWSSAPIRAHIVQQLDSVQVLPWSADIEAQEQETRTQVLRLLQANARPTGIGPKKPYITDHLWDLRKQSIAHRKVLKRLRVRLARESLHRVFYAWSGQQPATSPEQAFEFGTSLRIDALKTMAGFITARNSLRTGLREIKNVLLKQRMASINEHTAASTILQHLKEFTGPTNPKKQKRRPVPLLQDGVGKVCTTPLEALDTWIQFFADMEGGRRQSPQALREDWIHTLQAAPAAPMNVSVQELPTLVDLELAFRRVSCGKATGPDQVPGEVCHYAPAACASTHYAALWKLILYGHEALMHKGGLLVQAYKGKGPTTACSSYRSLLISSHFGKALHRTLRSTQATVFETYLQSQQLGGRRAMPVTYGLHLARAFQRQAKGRGRSCAVIFLDLKEAFYRIFRPLCMSGSYTDESLAQLLAKLNMPPDALHVLQALLQEPPALEQAGLSPLYCNSVSAVHAQTHFWMRSQLDVVQTFHGTRPGDPFADIIFSYIWAIVLHKLQLFMVEHDFVSKFPDYERLQLFATPEDNAVEHTAFVGPTWMDDLAVCLEAESPEHLVHKTGVVSGKLLELCIEHCMTPNLTKNKTEVLFSFKGHKSRKHKCDFYGPQSTGLLPVINEYGTYDIPVTASYTHLGGVLHHTTDLAVEIRRRLGVAFAAFNQHRRLLFRNWTIPLAKRVQLFESLILSKLLYGAETWVVSNDRTVAHFHAALMRLYRRLLPVGPECHLQDDELLAELRMLSPLELIRRSRLRYVATLLHCGRRHEWGLLRADAAWTALVEDDMRWLWQQLHHSSALQEPDAHWTAWETLIVDHRSYWKRLVRRACEHAIMQRALHWHTREFHEHFTCILRTHFDYEPRAAQPRVADTTFGCLHCRLRCNSKAGEAAHMFKVHGHIARRRQFVDSTTCSACLKNFHTVEKLMAHLYYGAACRRTLVSRNFVCPRIPGAGSRVDRDRQREHDRLLPPLQTAGPLQQAPRPRADNDVDADLHLYFMETCLDAAVFDDALQRLPAIIEQRPISWTTWTTTLAYFIDTLEDEDVQRWTMSLAEVCAGLRQLLSPMTWQLDRPLPRTTPPAAELEQECRDFAVTDWDPALRGPQQFGCHRVLLHLFSGRRRLGDLQYFLDSMDPPTGYVLHVVSLDIVVDELWGDVMAPGTRSYWLRIAQEGHVAAFLAGPPCETWSQARGKAVAALQRGRAPRIVRTAEHLWGLPSLALKELQQVMVGNCLLTFTLLMAAVMVTTGGLGIVEHPAEPTDEAAAAIWRLPALLALLSAPGVNRHRMAQGLFGAPSAKPTDLLSINLPGLVQHLRSWMIRTELPFGQAIGLNKEGKWKTGYLKEYPPAMCGALADAFRSGLDGIPPVPHREPSASDLARWNTLTVTSYSSHMGPDYAK